MKKKYLTMAVAAIFATASICSCGGKDKGSKERDDDDVEAYEDDDEDAPDADVTDQTNAWMSQDLATFDLHGRVVEVSYDKDHHTQVNIVFSDKGKLRTLKRMNGQQVAETATVTRDEFGRIVAISFEDDAPWETRLSYEGDDGMVPTMYMNTNTMGNYTMFEYTRDADGKLIKANFEEAIHGQTVETGKHTVTLSDYDEHGNWLVCTHNDGEYDFVTMRTITYSDGTVSEPEDPAMRDELMVMNFITDMYNQSRYEDYGFLREHCSPQMLQYLADSYEYDGEGLAVWLFRTSAQDSKPGYAGEKNKVTDLRRFSADGWWTYKFTDGGWEGEKRIRVLVKDGKCIIDDLEDVYDECAEASQQ